MSDEKEKSFESFMELMKKSMAMDMEKNSEVLAQMRKENENPHPCPPFDNKPRYKIEMYLTKEQLEKVTKALD